MKKIIHFAAAAFLALSLGGCYEDKGNYEYTAVTDARVDVASGVYLYNAKLGEHINIPMTVEIEGVPESELEYFWEIKNSAVFRELPGVEGRDFDRTLGPDDDFNAFTTYIVRLTVIYEEKGYKAKAYSPLISLVLSGDTGLLVAHGDDSGVDLGLICNDMFLVSASSTTEAKITYDNYSSVNGGKIPGKLIFAKHQDNATVANAWIYTLTDQGMSYCSPITFGKLGDYDDLFYSTPDYKFYNGKPEALFFYGNGRVLIDDGQLFYGFPPNKFAKSHDFSTNITIPLTEYDMSEHGVYEYSHVRDMNSPIAFDKLRRGFLKLSFSSTQSVVYFDSNNGPFNPNDMKADLLYFGFGGMVDSGNNLIGVFRDDNDELFLGEFNFSAPDEPGNTWARFKYSVEPLPEFGAAKFYGFGNTNAMCYYATDNAVYQYALAGNSGATNGRKLMLGIDGQNEFPITGEVTMMKVLKPATSNPLTAPYQFYGEILLVATYENGEGTLYAIRLHPITGNAISYETFGGFDRIYDANLKTR